MKKKFINTIGLVAHDSRKKDLIEWVKFNRESLIPHTLICTGTTGKLVEEALRADSEDLELNITKLKSGPLGGDQQLGAMIAEGNVDMMIFLWDPMGTQPHDVDVKALLRIASLYNVPTACNRSTADFLITSPLMDSTTYSPARRDFSSYLNRDI